MLLQFKIRNFRSIRNEVVIDFTPSSKIKKSDLPNNIITKGKYSAVSSLILYGRNASGKSNILKAFETMILLIRNSDKNKHGDKLPFYPFAFDVDFHNKPTEFEITFLTKSLMECTFLIGYNSEGIIKESLYIANKGKKIKVYDRDKNKFTRGKFLKGSIKTISDEMIDSQLFLSLSARKKIKYLDEIYLYLSFDLLILNYEQGEADKFITHLYSNLFMSHKNTKKNITMLLTAADTNITNYLISLEDDDSDLYNQFKELRTRESVDSIIEKNISSISEIALNKTKIETFHPTFKAGKKLNEEIKLNFNEESLGTRKLYSLSMLILSRLNTGSSIIIDELDKSLHPLLTRMLIGLFHSKKNNPKGAQLVFATHDATLLDNELFRRDQIMFVEKGYEGATEVYKMSDMTGVRDNIPYDKWYLSGRFKAVPIISEVELEF